MSPPSLERTILVMVPIEANRPTGFWTFPIGTVSQSESGIELVHQSVVVQPHWIVRGDKQGRWSVVMRLSADTSLAQQRQQQTDQQLVTV